MQQRFAIARFFANKHPISPSSIIREVKRHAILDLGMKLGEYPHQATVPIPADWVKGECLHCFLRFATMAKQQRRD
ncbi:MAG: hypothetical protein HEQ27_15815 [Dolichospermum sp. JUN01]|nr:hypothetical protein [Dolichospermum sp. JUN01]